MPEGSSAYSLCVTLVDAKIEKRIKDAGLCVCDSFYLVSVQKGRVDFSNPLHLSSVDGERGLSVPEGLPESL